MTDRKLHRQQRQSVSRSGKEWSCREDQLLTSLIMGGRSASQVAAALLRTTRAIRKRAEVLKVSWKRRSRNETSNVGMQLLSSRRIETIGDSD